MTKHLRAILAILSAVVVEAGNVFAFHGTAQKVDSFVILVIGTVTAYLIPNGSANNGGSTATKPTAQ